MEWLVEAQRRAEQPHCFETRSPSGYRFNQGPGPSPDVPIRWKIPELGEVVTGRTNGTPMSIARTKPSPGLELAMRAEGPASLLYTVVRNGAVDGGGRLMLVDNGTAWVDLTWAADRQDLASVLVYVRE